MTGSAIRFRAAFICCTIAAGRGKLLNLKEYYPKMLAHCKEYLDSVGDHPLNLASTNLGLERFRADAADASTKTGSSSMSTRGRQRTEQCGGNIPTNVGLDGKPGGEYDGQWWKGTYGWNFTIFDGELEEIAHRNTFTAGAWPGFGNALLLTGDQSFVGVLRRQMDNIYAQKKVENGKTLLPQMYGDPKGYKENGPPSWYHYTGNLFQDRLTEIYFWSMDRKDLERVPMRGLVGFLEGKDPDYPVKALQADLERVRKTMREIETDSTTADTRLADYLHGFESVARRMLWRISRWARTSRTGSIWSLHSRFRYFDPVRRRAGLAGGCRRAGGEARGRWRHADSGERRSGRGSHGGRAGRRLRRASVRVGRDRTARRRRLRGRC